MTRLRSRLGVTLIELLVTLGLLGTMAGVVGLAISGATREPDVSEPTAHLTAARREALRSGKPISISLVLDGRTYAATALPDGSVRGDSIFDADPLTGRPSDD